MYSRVFPLKRELYLWSFLIALWEPAALFGNTREYTEYTEYTE